MRGSVRAMARTGGVLSAQCQAGIRGALSRPVRAIDGPPSTTPSAPFDRQRFVRRVVVAGSLAVVAVQALLYIVGWIANHVAIPLGLDWLGYRAGFDRLLATGTPYAPFELAGAFTPEHLDFIHPPNALVLFAPFAILPQPLDYILWIGIPIAIFCYLLRGLPWWAWPAVALLSTTNSLQYPILNGNSSLFMTAIFGLGFRYGWVVGLLAMKPTLAPLAIVGFRRSRGPSCIAAALAVVPILLIAAVVRRLPDGGPQHAGHPADLLREQLLAHRPGGPALGRRTSSPAGRSPRGVRSPRPADSAPLREPA